MTKVQDTRENYRICMKDNCSTCPSHPNKSGEGLYCARGPSKLPVEKKGCFCTECLVWFDNSLSGTYYCSGVDKG